MAIIRPRLIDYFDIPITQEEVDFAIPFLDEDIPLYLDPFLLWKSPSQQDNALHFFLISAFNQLGRMSLDDNARASKSLIELSECSEVGLGNGKTKKGLRISAETAHEVLELFSSIPQVKMRGFSHLEEIQLYVNFISKDRVSDISCNLVKSFLIDFTQDQCIKHNIPTREFHHFPVFDVKSSKFDFESVKLPYNPEESEPIILVPKRWLRYTPWINYEDYFKNAFIVEGSENDLEKAHVLNYNRNHYDMVSAFVASRERAKSDCKNDPMFKQIPVTSAKKCLDTITNLPIGKTNNADKKYEDNCARLM